MKNHETKFSKEEILRIRGTFTAKYGIVPDDSLTLLLCEIHEIGVNFGKSGNTYQINGFWAAFALGLGRFGMAAIVFFGIILLFIYRNYYGSFERVEQYNYVNNLLKKYPNLSDFEDFIKDSKRVNNPEGLPNGTYLTFKVSGKIKDGFKSSTQGIMNSDSTVYVPLYFKLKSN
jgi:hypothetical protein